MADTPAESGLNLGEEHELMREELVFLAFCSLMALIGLAVAGWEAVTGRILSLDGLSLSLISLTLAAVFGGNVAWSIYKGDVQRLLSHLRKGSTESSASDKNRPATA